MRNSNKYLFPFILVTSLFFLWGFIHNFDPVLIPHLRKAFSLTTLQSSLIDSAVYVGYFVMALPAGAIMRKYGYKAGIITGLLLFATGSFLFIPAANTQQYVFFLGALFIIACGLAILETAANPYAALLGSPEKATQRLNFAQSFNGLAVTLAPMIGVKVIMTEGLPEAQLNAMSEAARTAALASEASSVKMPYFILGCILLVVALFFVFTKLPQIKSEEESGSKNVFHALKHRHLSWAVAAQFFYVGAQVCVMSFFILYAMTAVGLTKGEAGRYLGLGCGMAFMIGRFAGTFFMKYVEPPRLLALYSFINILLCLVVIFGHGMITIYAMIGIAFFMSIMFPTIFALGIKGLKSDTEFGSSLIIMSIVGGAFLPPALAYIADRTGNIQYGYVMPLISFAVIFYYGLQGYKVVSNKNVIVDEKILPGL
jgi:FHS family L-fucose permease-like MFS transporter